ncbi:energy transducer TonB [Sphingomonas rhizophila]|uniref:Energy transducer TonB n=1 Tax=Sphingomonas rhizophila TaxID=2071607 RepID=A0A7G9S8N2_9SPHN|nr:energy transducer TonB [Sphingomonas rhizophila]QNN64207.1 energy transducer TonB [Sphingomonas rhizophila]
MRSFIFAIGALAATAASAQVAPKVAGQKWSVVPIFAGCALESPIAGSARFNSVRVAAGEAGKVGTVSLTLAKAEASTLAGIAAKVGRAKPRAGSAYIPFGEPTPQITLQLEPHELTALADGQPLLVAFPKSEILAIDFGAINLFQEGLDKCNRVALAELLGPLDTDEVPVTPPSIKGGSLVSIFNASDYPVTALKREIQGRVIAVLRVDADGRPSACKPFGPREIEELKRATCTILRSRARYVPARAASGAAISSYTRTTIAWVLP